MFGLGMPELILILVICLLVFGAAKLPEVGRNLGKAIGEFKKGMKDGEAPDKKDGPSSS
jgi:TatA/E family protein of Tat protein translocase